MIRTARSRAAAAFAAAPLLLPLAAVGVFAGCSDQSGDPEVVEGEVRTPEQEAEMRSGRAAAEEASRASR